MDKLIVFRRCYEYLFWLRPTVERFARVHKHSLGAEMQSCGLNLLRLVVKANYSEIRTELIKEAIIEYEVQRIYLRLAYEYKLVNKRQFDFASDKLEEIARLLRAWQKKYN